jgi:hypothetical protein
MAADCQFLFGLLALQNGIINQGQLLAAFQAWTLKWSRSLADHMAARVELDDHEQMDTHNSVAQFGEGEPPCEPVGNAARTEPRPSRATHLSPRFHSRNAHMHHSPQWPAARKIISSAQQFVWRPWRQQIVP